MRSLEPTRLLILLKTSTPMYIPVARRGDRDNGLTNRLMYVIGIILLLLKTFSLN
jgi:hypothetical protein